MSKKDGINDEERRLWVLNDAGLYGWYRSTRQPLKTFIRENRAEIDKAIIKVRDAPPRS